MLGQVACGLVSLLLAHPLCEQAQGVIPEGVDLHGLATSWRHHPIAYFGVHPGQLVALLPLLQEAILWIDVNAKVRTAQVVRDNVQQCREDQREGGTILGHLEVAVDGMEEPECRVSGMIQALLSTFREHVWHQTVADVAGKGAQDPARLDVAPGDQGFIRLPDGRIRIQIETLQEFDYQGRFLRVRLPGSPIIDLGVPRALFASSAP